MPYQGRLTVTTTDKNDMELINEFKRACKKDKKIYSQIVIDLIREYLISRQFK